MGSFRIAHAALIAMGAFYTFAGFVGLRVALQSRLIDVAIAGISMTAPAKVETARGLWLLVASLVVLAGGVFLILRLDWAAVAFVTSVVGQAVYLLVIAPKFFDLGDPPDATGRQQTVNAFILYSAATLFVLWGYRTGKLISPEHAGWLAVSGALGVVAGATAYGLFRFFYPLAKAPSIVARRDKAGDAYEGEAFDADDPDALDQPGPALSNSQRILVMSEYQCDSLWTHETGRSGSFSPRDLPLPDDLIADLEAWSQHYDTSFNHEDYNHPLWNEAQYAAHDEAGVALARRLKRALPERQIFVWRDSDGNLGPFEIQDGE